MRRIVSIVMVFMMLLSVIHLSVVSHLCQGKVMAVRVSLVDQNSYSCGMEDQSAPSPDGKVFKKNCCKNESTSLTVDSNYSPTFSKSLPVFQKVIHRTNIIISELVMEAVFTGKTAHALSPPDIVPIQSVEQADICVFRI